MISAESALHTTEKELTLIPACDHYAGKEKFIQKVFALQDEGTFTFDITCDLEDGAPAGKEREHAKLIVDLIQSSPSEHRRVGVRVHDPEHPHFLSDLDVVLPVLASSLTHLTIPKVSSGQRAEEVVSLVQTMATDAGRATPLPLHFLIETHQALHDVWKIASFPHVRGLDFGLMDFISSHSGAIPAECMQSPGQFDHPLVRRAKIEISAAAIAHGVTPSHSVTTDFSNTEQTYNDAHRAYREFGYLRMWSIHPSQIEPICRAMTPSYDEIHFATELLLQAQQASWGPIRFNDRLHDRASFRYYWELVKRAKVCGAEVDEESYSKIFAPKNTA